MEPTLGRDLILWKKYAVLFTSTFKLAHERLSAKRELRLEECLCKLGHFDAIILDAQGCVQQEREEMEPLFTFRADCCERRSVRPCSNLVIAKWDLIFKDRIATMAAIGRLVHRAIIRDFNGESLRPPRFTEKGGG